MGNVKWDLRQLYVRYWSDNRKVVAFKDVTLERDLLMEMKIRWLDLEA